jgi:hypothetical protein
MTCPRPRLKVVGIVNTRSAAAPSTGHVAAVASSPKRRETSNSSPQVPQRKSKRGMVPPV